MPTKPRQVRSEVEAWRLLRSKYSYEDRKGRTPPGICAVLAGRCTQISQSMRNRMRMATFPPYLAEPRLQWLSRKIKQVDKRRRSSRRSR
jgi:hypothetical protein